MIIQGLAMVNKNKITFIIKETPPMSFPLQFYQEISPLTLSRDDLMNRGDYYLGTPIPSSPPILDNDPLSAIPKNKRSLEDESLLKKTTKPKSRIPWTATEIEQLKQLAEQLASEDNFSFRGLARLFSEKNPHRTPSAALRHIIRLFDHGTLRLQPTPLEQSQTPPFSVRHRWTLEEKNQLKKLAEQMVKEGTFTMSSVCQWFSKNNPHRTERAAHEMVSKMIENGTLVIPHRKPIWTDSQNSKKWTLQENQLLNRLMKEHPSSSYLQIAHLFVAQTVGRERSISAICRQIYRLKE
jgi:hypothetical protein